MTTRYKFFQTWTFRVLFAFLFSPGVAILAGVLFSLDVTTFEGANGFAFVYIALWSLPIAFLAMLLIKSMIFQILIGLLAVSGYLTLGL